MGIGLSIVFTGLCALVTDAGHGSGQVLLVDAQGIGEVGGVLLPEHAPTLVLSLDNLVNAETSQPTRVVAAWPVEGVRSAGSGQPVAGAIGQLGIWDLTGSEVRIRVQGGSEGGLRVFHPRHGTSSWPAPPRDANDAQAWRDLRFVADMKALAGDARVDPALVDGAHDAGRWPRAIASRIHLDAGIVAAGIPSQGAHRGDLFEFRGLDGRPRLRQALTDTIRWSLVTPAEAVVIEIERVADGSVKRLVLKPSATGHTAYVSNLPSENVPASAHHATSSEEMAALHFAAYYELLQRKPMDRPLPWLLGTQASRRATGMMHGPFCPPAVFQRD
jgi:hypothetical protein